MTQTERQQSVTASPHAVEASAPLNAQFLDGRVVNIRGAADEHHDAFLFGRFKRLGNTDGRSLGGGDFLNDQGEIIAHRVFRVSGSSLNSLLGNVGHPGITLIDAPDAASGDDVLAIIDGVVKQVLDTAGDIGHSKALSHGYLPIEVKLSEGASTARSMLSAMLTEFSMRSAA